MPVAGGASHLALLTFVVRAEPERHLHGRVTASARNGWLASEPPGLLANRDATYPGQARLFLQLKEVLPSLIRHHLPPGCKDYAELFKLTN